jgi:beta-lactamase regulating signal transducer with metallopeptidase domain/stalled ribosome alternative rescue factor ArfA
MIEQHLIEYLANGFWQLPLLAAGAWLLLRIVKPEPAVQHRVWVAVLVMAVLLPLRGAVSGKTQVEVVQAQPVAVGRITAFSPDAFAGDAFDAIGQPGGLVLGHSTAWAWQDFSNLVLASRVRRVRLNATVVHWIVGLYLAMGLLGLVRLARAWRGARRLVAESREIAPTDWERAVVVECARRIGVAAPKVRELRTREPRVQKLRGTSGPVVVGATKPLLLWREGFARDLLARDREDELMAALCHEMAHIRRHDYLMNLLCEAAALPLKWHPVTYAVEGRIRSTREMVCDAIAAGAMESETKYAKCLLSLAQSMVGASGIAAPAAGPAAALGLFSNNALEERVMRLMRTRIAMSGRAKVIRGVTGGAALVAALGLAAAFHIVPAMAQSQTQPASQGAQTKVETTAPAAADVQLNSAEVKAASPVVKPVVHVAPVVRVQPVVQLASVTPVVHVEPMVRVAAPVVRVSPVVHVDSVPPMVQTAPSAPPAPDAKTPNPPPPPSAPPPGAQKEPPAPAAPAPPVAHRSQCEDDGDYAIVNGVRRKLTPEEKRKVDAQLAEAQRKLAEATATLNSPEFREQIEKAQRGAMEATQKLNSAEFQKQMADAQKQIADATAKLNSPEFRQQIEKAQRDAMEAKQKLNSTEFQKQMADAQKQLAEATARINSPEFRQQMEKAQRDAMEAAQRVNSAEFAKQMADAQKRLADAMAQIKAEQKDDSEKK